MDYQKQKKISDRNHNQKIKDARLREIVRDLIGKNDWWAREWNADMEDELKSLSNFRDSIHYDKHHAAYNKQDERLTPRLR